MLDKRSLGVLRICLGSILMLDVAARALYFRAHYTYLGIAPLDQFLYHEQVSRRPWSVLYISDSPYWAAGLLFLSFIAALTLTVGYRVRLSGWISWILALSVANRGPLLGDGGVQYMICLLMWGNFLPWGDRFSLESVPEENSDCRTLAGFCLITQVAIVYWFSAVLRVGKEWQVDNSALYFAMHVDPLTTNFGEHLPWLGLDVLAFFTFTTLLLEMLGPLLLYLPSTGIRLFTVIMLVAFHLGILVTLRIPFFVAVCVAAALGLLPPKFWGYSLGEAVERRLDTAFQVLGRRLTSKKKEEERNSRFETFYRLLPVPILLVIILQLWAGLGPSPVRSPLTPLARNLNLNQYWGMFSPFPMNFVGWESVVARTESGREITLLKQGSRTSWPDLRWRYFQISLGKGRPKEVELFLNYLVADWDRRNPADKIVAAQYLYHPEHTRVKYILRNTETQVLGVYQSE